MNSSPPGKPVPSRPFMDSVRGRADVSRMAPSDPAQALVLARAIPDAWYRAQALSFVAEHASEPDVPGIIAEAVAAAYDCADAYGTVAVMSWTLLAALKRGYRSSAEHELEKVLLLAPAVEPRASRACALDSLWSHCFDADEELAKPIWRAILALCNPNHHWREARLYRHVAETRERRHPGSAAAVIAAMPEGKARAALARRLGIARLGIGQPGKGQLGISQLGIARNQP